MAVSQVSQARPFLGPAQPLQQHCMSHKQCQRPPLTRHGAAKDALHCNQTAMKAHQNGMALALPRHHALCCIANRWLSMCTVHTGTLYQTNASLMVFSISILTGLRLQDLVAIQSDLRPEGTLHRLKDSAPGFSKAQHLLDTLVEQNAGFKASMMPPAATSAASGPAEPSNQLLAASSAGSGAAQSRSQAAAAATFSQQLELVIESVLLWAQTLHRPAAAVQEEQGDKDAASGKPSQRGVTCKLTLCSYLLMSTLTAKGSMAGCIGNLSARLKRSRASSSSTPFPAKNASAEST